MVKIGWFRERLDLDGKLKLGFFRYTKFDTFTPAAEKGLPVTRVISRMTLQEILARAVGNDVILNDSNVVDFTDDGSKVFNIPMMTLCVSVKRYLSDVLMYYNL